MTATIGRGSTALWYLTRVDRPGRARPALGDGRPRHRFVDGLGRRALAEVLLPGRPPEPLAPLHRLRRRARRHDRRRRLRPDRPARRRRALPLAVPPDLGRLREPGVRLPPGGGRDERAPPSARPADVAWRALARLRLLAHRRAPRPGDRERPPVPGHPGRRRRLRRWRSSAPPPGDWSTAVASPTDGASAGRSAGRSSCSAPRSSPSWARCDRAGPIAPARRAPCWPNSVGRPPRPRRHRSNRPTGQRRRRVRRRRPPPSRRLRSRFPSLAATRRPRPVPARSRCRLDLHAKPSPAARRHADRRTGRRRGGAAFGPGDVRHGRRPGDRVGREHDRRVGHRARGTRAPGHPGHARSGHGNGQRIGIGDPGVVSGGTSIRPAPPVRADALPRLLAGLATADRPSGLDAHLDQWGPVDWRRTRLNLVGEVDASGLVGHGGAWFPVGAKWRAITRQRGRRPVVVANGAEGEPASGKDALLLTQAPHLVLDGLASASVALRAADAVVYVPEHLAGPVEAAITMRRRRHLDPVTMMVARAPDTYLAGQEAAVVRSLNGGPALPYFVGLRSVRQRGVDGRPTLVQNVETLAHVALIARFGARWFKGMGTAERPGTMLLSVSGRWDRAAVVEAPLGARFADVLDLAPSDVGRYWRCPARRLRRWMGTAGGVARPARRRAAGPPGRRVARRRGRRPAADDDVPAGRGGPGRPLHGGPGSRTVRSVRRGPGRRWPTSSSDVRSAPARAGPASARFSTCAPWSRAAAPAGTPTASPGSPAARARSSPTRSPSTSATDPAARPGAPAGSPSPAHPGHPDRRPDREPR